MKSFNFISNDKTIDVTMKFDGLYTDAGSNVAILEIKDKSTSSAQHGLAGIQQKTYTVKSLIDKAVAANVNLKVIDADDNVVTLRTQV